VICCQFKAKQWTRDLFLVGYLQTCRLVGLFCQNLLLSTKDLAGSSSKTFIYQTKIWRMNYNHNCKYHNFIKLIQPQLLQINPIIHQHCNYMDHDTSIKLGDGGRSEEMRPKIWDVGVGQRRRDAMLSVQSKVID
jgi:hypothetical protein